MNEIIRYFTYQETLSIVAPQVAALPRHPHDSDADQDWWTKVIEEMGMEFSVYTLSEYFTDDLINQVVNALMWVVYDRHAEDYVASGIVYPSYEGSLEIALTKNMSALISILDLTIPKYIPLLQQAEIASTAPLTPNVDEHVEEGSGETSDDYLGENSSRALGKNRVNDVPQNGGDFDDDPHASQVSASDNSVENNASSENRGNYSSRKRTTDSLNVGTLMSRLDELFRNFRSVILEWSNEFNRAFLNEVQL